MKAYASIEHASVELVAALAIPRMVDRRRQELPPQPHLLLPFTLTSTSIDNDLDPRRSRSSHPAVARRREQRRLGRGWNVRGNDAFAGEVRREVVAGDDDGSKFMLGGGDLNDGAGLRVVEQP